jgi:tetratricopeptide (TPR) repeat protein
MDAWLRSIVASGVLLAATGSALAQESPPRAALEALAGIARRRPAASTSGPTDLDRALAAADWPRAEQLLAEAIERSPRSVPLLEQIAGVFLADRRPLNAAIALKKAEALAPLHPESRLRLVLAYVAMGQREWARPELERLIRDAPDVAIHHYWLGRLDYDAGQYAAAIAHLQAAATRDPSFPRTFDNLGLCYDALNEGDLALPQYREAVRLNRLATDPSPWPPLNLGIALARRGESGEAEALLREAIRVDPRASRAHYHLGTVLEDTNQPDAAIVSLRAAADADPAYPEPLYALARIYRRQGRTAEADAALAAFLARRTTDRAGARAASTP